MHVPLSSSHFRLGSLRRYASRVDPILVVALVVGLGLRLGWLQMLDAVPFHDAEAYLDLANKISQGEQFENFGLAYWPVGYPLTLAAFFGVFGSSIAVGEAVNILASLAIIGLTYNIAYQFYSRSIARLAAVLIALLPSQIFSNTLLLTETLFTAVMLGAVALIAYALNRGELEWDLKRIFVRRGTAVAGLGFLVPTLSVLWIGALVALAAIAGLLYWARRTGNYLAMIWIGAGILTGYAMLIRPAAAILVPVTLLTAYIVHRQQVKRAPEDGASPLEKKLFSRSTLTYPALYVIVSMLVIMPWMARNQTEIGTFNLATSTGINLLVGNHDGATGCWSWDDENHGYIWQMSDEMERNREAMNHAVDFISNDPGQVALLIPLRFDCTWSDDNDAIGHWNRFEQPDALDRRTHEIFSFLNRWYYYGLLGFAFMGIPAWWRGKSAAVILPLIVALTSIYYLAFIGEDRYHQPLLPIFAIWAAAGITLIPRWFRLRPVTWPRDGK